MHADCLASTAIANMFLINIHTEEQVNKYTSSISDCMIVLSIKLLTSALLALIAFAMSAGVAVGSLASTKCAGCSISLKYFVSNNRAITQALKHISLRRKHAGTARCTTHERGKEGEATQPQSV